MKLLNAEQLSQMIGYKIGTIYHYYKQGKLPKPKRIMGKILWDEEEIKRWIKEQSKQRGE